jgi:hypothetical protein
MDAAQRAKAIVIQLETLRDGERLNPDLRILALADYTAAKEALHTARIALPRPVWSDLERRIAAVRLWLTSRDMRR